MTGADGQIIRAERGVLVELAQSGTQKPLVALVPMEDDAAVEILSAPDQLASVDSSEPPADSAQIEAQKEVITILVMPPANLYRHTKLERKKYSANQGNPMAGPR